MTSPVSVFAWTRIPPWALTVASPLTVWMPYGPEPSMTASTSMSPLVVVSIIDGRRPPWIVMSPDTERTATRVSPSGPRATSPDTLSTVTVPAIAVSSIEPDAER